MSRPQLPFVSCLMPTKHRREFIHAASKMFLKQDYAGGMELICVEDGDDDVRDLLASAFATVEPHAFREGAHYVYRRFEGTLGAKLNYARDMAAGRVLVNWDDDDYNAPNRISQQIEHMRLTGRPFVGMSSMIFHQPGDDFGWQYTGDAWYAPGSSHVYTKEYAMENPRPDKTVGEDNDCVERAALVGALSTVSGLTSLVARNHPGNCSARIGKHTEDPTQQLFIRLRDEGLIDQYKKIPIARFQATIDAAR